MKQQSKLDEKKQEILQALRAKNHRITNQRLVIIDIILREECSSTKEIYYKAIKKDPNIGTATVYRMVNTLEDIGAIRRKNIYEIQSLRNGTNRAETE